MVLAAGSPLDQQPAIVVEHKDGKRPMEFAFAMGAELFLRPNDVVIAIDEGDEVRHHVPSS